MTEQTDAQLVQKLLNDIAPYLAIRGMAHMADAAVCAAQRLEARGESEAISEAKIDRVAEALRHRGLILRRGDVRAALEAVKEPSP